MTPGRLAGIARHERKHGAVETLESVAIGREGGMPGDHPSAVASQKISRKRQVSLIERASWEAALAEIGGELAWWHSRRNFLLDDLRLPRAAGTRLQIGPSLVIEITDQCAPCHRMEALLPGLHDAMRPDWRGGFVARVEQDGAVAVDDEIRIL
jgi:MOSC domain-containing protein YiiM